MGRTIKISELKPFDVFVFDMQKDDERFVNISNSAYNRYMSLESFDYYNFGTLELLTEVELLGRMEFIEEGIEIVKFVSNDKGQLILADFGDSM